MTPAEREELKEEVAEALSAITGDGCIMFVDLRAHCVCLFRCSILFLFNF